MLFNISVAKKGDRAAGSDGGKAGNCGSDAGDAQAAQENERLMKLFMAGVMRRINEITLFLNPTRNSYQRLGTMQAPGYVSWSEQNRSQLIRIPAVRSANRRFELRSPDPMTNPYLSYALVIEAGLEGIRDRLAIPAPVDVNLYTANPEIRQGLTRLPADFDEAVQFARRSEFVRRLLPDGYLSAYSKR